LATDVVKSEEQMVIAAQIARDFDLDLIIEVRISRRKVFSVTF
jgi:hypothetical protein